MEAAAASNSSSGSAGVRSGATTSTSSSSSNVRARTGATASIASTGGGGAGGGGSGESKGSADRGYNRTGSKPGRLFVVQAPGKLLVDVMRLVFDLYGSVRDDIVLSMPFDPRLLLWWHLRRRLEKSNEFFSKQLGAMVFVQRMLARIQLMKLAWRLDQGGEVAAEAERVFRAQCERFLDTRTYQHVWRTLVGGKKTDDKDERVARILKVAKEGDLSDEDEEKVS